MYKNLEHLRQSIEAAAPLSHTENQAFELLVQIGEITSQIHQLKTEITSNKVRRTELAKNRSTDHMKLKVVAGKLFRANEEAEATLLILKERKQMLSGELAPLRSIIESEHDQLFNEVDRHNNSIKTAYVESAEVRQAFKILKACAEFAGRSPEGMLHDTDWDTVGDHAPDATQQLKPVPKVERLDLIRRIDQATMVR